ncbi:MAG: class I lanthipeptide [Candidatus Aminicenantes bacterium]
MKQTRFNKKLVIKKVTISNLTKEQQLSVRGGGTLQGDTCEGTVQGRTCDEYSTVATCQ